MPSSFSPSSTSPSLSRSSSFTFFISSHAMDHRGGIEQLHFDVPLISTRRSASANASKSSHLGSNQDDYIDTSRSVPFSWEAAPGVPKRSVRRTDSSKEEEEVFFTPKPPPGRWRPPNRRKDREQHNNAGRDNECSNGSSSDDLVLNATVLDKVSLSESLDTACRFGPGANRAPSFIMNRFLPAASALAAASLDKYSQQRRTPPAGSREQQAPVKLRRRQRGVAYAAAAAKVPMEHVYNVRHTNARPATPSSGCGLVELFPSSLKSIVCRFKSPVRCQTPKIATLEAFAQRCRRISASDGLSSEDGLSSKACKSPGWGLPLLDTSRVRIRGAGVDLEKGRRLVDGKDQFRDGRRTPRTTTGVGRPLPMLKTPTDPWLSHALNYANSKY